MKHTPPSCSLTVSFAEKSDKAVILRRGPSAWVRMILWDTVTDRLRRGQWIKAALYAGHLSPNGELFACHVVKKNKRTKADKEIGWAWTAISRPPAFEAIYLWPRRSKHYGCGGHFIDDSTFRLNHFEDEAIPSPKHHPRKLRVIPGLYKEGELPLSKFVRVEPEETPEGMAPAPPRSEYPRPSKGRRKRPADALVYEGGVMSLRAADGARVELPGVSWATFTRHGRLVFARGGALSSGEVVDGRLEETLIADFTAERPDPKAWTGSSE